MPEEFDIKRAAAEVREQLEQVGRMYSEADEELLERIRKDRIKRGEPVILRPGMRRPLDGGSGERGDVDSGLVWSDYERAALAQWRRDHPEDTRSDEEIRRN